MEKDNGLRYRRSFLELVLDIPQTRNSDFYPSSLEKGVRSERALNLALAQMYVQGVSTRDVSKIIGSVGKIRIYA